MSTKKKSGKRFGRKSRALSVVLAIIAVVGILCQVFPPVHHAVRYCGIAIWEKICAIFGSNTNVSYDVAFPEDGKRTEIVVHSGYALGYCEKYEQPLWVMYKLTSDHLKKPVTARTDEFMEDPKVFTGSALPEDYSRSGYDRGHLAPAADMKYDKTTMEESFYMSNMSPQMPAFNRGIWSDLENMVRNIAYREHEVYIVTGPILQDNCKYEYIGRGNKVAVPLAFYKVVYDITPPQKMIGFILPNREGKGKLKDYAVTVKQIEKETGLTLFPNLTDAQTEAMKKTISVKDWGL